ncbi:hypothetical protein Cni_G15795 [Canna indica]|uniref:Secreted protein n=1 Tax=Canna indica TaxID=4628 RepID=A0AAQ3KE17_9LILI|nr:hypothetical protein Cni_G15795 [Canna indica]
MKGRSHLIPSSLTWKKKIKTKATRWVFLLLALEVAHSASADGMPAQLMAHPPVHLICSRVKQSTAALPPIMHRSCRLALSRIISCRLVKVLGFQLCLYMTEASNLTPIIQ